MLKPFDQKDFSFYPFGCFSNAAFWNSSYATDVITIGSLQEILSLAMLYKYSEAGSHGSVKKTGVCARPSFFITELLIQVLLGKHPTVKIQALSSLKLERSPPSWVVQSFIRELNLATS